MDIRFKKQNNGQVKLQMLPAQDGEWCDVPLVDWDDKPLKAEVILSPTLRPAG